MKRADETPYDGPSCEWCGRYVEEGERRCRRCQEERDEVLFAEREEARRDADRLERREAVLAVVGTERAA